MSSSKKNTKRVRDAPQAIVPEMQFPKCDIATNTSQCIKKLQDKFVEEVATGKNRSLSRCDTLHSHIVEYEQVLKTQIPCDNPSCKIQGHQPTVRMVTAQFNDQEEVDNKDECLPPPKKLANIATEEQALGTVPNIPTDNPFSILDVENMETGSITADPQTEKPRHEGLDILFKASGNYRLTISKLHEEHPDMVTKLQGDHIKVLTRNEAHFDQIKALLLEHEVEFITRTPRHKLPVKYVIKGLPADTPAEEIKQALEEQKLQVIKVTQLSSLRTKAKLPIFQILLPRQSRHSEIKKITRLLYLVVTIENFNRRTGPTVCYNCNRLGHSSTNCHAKPRCFKCGLEHQSRDCLIKEKITKPRCINCNEEGHLSIWRGCPLFPKKPVATPAQTRKGTFPESRKNAWTKPLTLEKELRKTKSVSDEIKELKDDIKSLKDAFNSLSDLFGGQENLKKFISHFSKIKNPQEELKNLCRNIGITLN